MWTGRDCQQIYTWKLWDLEAAEKSGRLRASQESFRCLLSRGFVDNFLYLLEIFGVESKLHCSLWSWTLELGEDFHLKQENGSEC